MSTLPIMLFSTAVVKFIWFDWFHLRWPRDRVNAKFLQLTLWATEIEDSTYYEYQIARKRLRILHGRAWIWSLSARVDNISREWAWEGGVRDTINTIRWIRTHKRTEYFMYNVHRWIWFFPSETILKYSLRAQKAEIICKLSS